MTIFHDYVSTVLQQFDNLQVTFYISMVWYYTFELI